MFMRPYRGPATSSPIGGYSLEFGVKCIWEYILFKKGATGANELGQSFSVDLRRALGSKLGRIGSDRIERSDCILSNKNPGRFAQTSL